MDEVLALLGGLLLGFIAVGLMFFLYCEGWNQGARQCMNYPTDSACVVMKAGGAK